MAAKIVIQNKITNHSEYPYKTIVWLDKHTKAAHHHFGDSTQRKAFVDGMMALASIVGADVRLGNPKIDVDEDE